MALLQSIEEMLGNQLTSNVGFNVYYWNMILLVIHSSVSR
jgi:hypothetical protein